MRPDRQEARTPARSLSWVPSSGPSALASPGGGSPTERGRSRRKRGLPVLDSSVRWPCSPGVAGPRERPAPRASPFFCPRCDRRLPSPCAACGAPCEPRLPFSGPLRRLGARFPHYTAGTRPRRSARRFQSGHEIREAYRPGQSHRPLILNEPNFPDSRCRAKGRSGPRNPEERFRAISRTRPVRDDWRTGESKPATTIRRKLTVGRRCVMGRSFRRAPRSLPTKPTRSGRSTQALAVGSSAGGALGEAVGRARLLPLG